MKKNKATMSISCVANLSNKHVRGYTHPLTVLEMIVQLITLSKKCHTSEHFSKAFKLTHISRYIYLHD